MVAARLQQRNGGDGNEIPARIENPPHLEMRQAPVVIPPSAFILHPSAFILYSSLTRRALYNGDVSITLRIPESVVQGLRLPEAEAEERLREELAVALYARQILSLGKAAELAGASRFHFAELLGRRGVSRHYTEEDLVQDLSYARGEVTPERSA